VGRDLIFEQAVFDLWSFNPRARVGRDQETQSLSPTSQCFNPRARVGRDVALGIL